MRDKIVPFLPIRPRAKPGWLVGICVPALFAIVCLCISVSPARSATGSTTQPAIPQTVDQLLQLFGVSNIPADFVVVIDTSGSMSFQGYRPYPAVQSAFQSFLGEIRPGDYLSLITFDTYPSLRYDAPVASTADRQTAVSALPPVATGNYTDIGAALDSTLTQLERPGASEVEIVLFMTDGIDDPGPGSPYPTTTGPEWTALAQRASALEKTHSIVAFGAGLAQGASTDIGLVRTVFPQAEIVALPPSQLPNFFNQAVDQARIEILRKPVNQELATGSITTKLVSESKLGNPTTATLRLRSDYGHLPVTVHVTGASATSANGSSLDATLIGGPRTVTLWPGRSSPDLTVSVAVPKLSGGGIGTSRQSQNFSVQLHTSATVEPASLLNLTLGVNTTAPVHGAGSVTAFRVVGTPYWKVVLALAIALLLLLLLFTAYRRFLAVPPLRFVLQTTSGETIALSGKRMSLPNPKAQFPAADAARAEFFTRRGKPKRVYVRAADRPVAVKSGGVLQQLSSDRRVAPGDEVIIGRARLRLLRSGAKQ